MMGFRSAFDVAPLAAFWLNDFSTTLQVCDLGPRCILFRVQLSPFSLVCHGLRLSIWPLESLSFIGLILFPVGSVVGTDSDLVALFANMHSAQRSAWLLIKINQRLFLLATATGLVFHHPILEWD